MHRYEQRIVEDYLEQRKNQTEQIAKEMSNLIQDDDVEGSFVYQEFLESMENSANTDIWFIDDGDNKRDLKK